MFSCLFFPCVLYQLNNSGFYLFVIDIDLEQTCANTDMEYKE